MGPAALGFHAQDIIHRITPSRPPKGWDYQVHNDVILNYDFMVDKEIYRDDISILGVKGTGRFVIYDATLQGGLFNKTSPYVIPSASVRRLVGDINMFLVFEIRGHQLGLNQHLISSRFNESEWHGWLGINYTYWW